MLLNPETGTGQITRPTRAGCEHQTALRQEFRDVRTSAASPSCFTHPAFVPESPACAAESGDHNSVEPSPHEETFNWQQQHPSDRR